MAESLGNEVMGLPYTILVAHGSDPVVMPYLNLVRSFFKKSLIDRTQGNPWFSDIDRGAYFEAYGPFVDTLIMRSTLRLALLKEDPDACLGFSLSEGTTLHYVFVKTGIAARKQGIGTMLLPPGIEKFTHLTRMGRVIWKKKYPHLKFNPFIT